MRRTIGVQIGDEASGVGSLHYNQQGNRESAGFEYDAGWLAAPDRFALEPALPLVAGPQFHRKVGTGSVFHAAIADTEPDGWGKRVSQRDHAKRRQDARRRGDEVDARALNGLDYLLAVDDVNHQSVSHNCIQVRAVDACRVIDLIIIGQADRNPLIELPDQTNPHQQVISGNQGYR